MCEVQGGCVLLEGVPEERLEEAQEDLSSVGGSAIGFGGERVETTYHRDMYSTFFSLRGLPRETDLVNDERLLSRLKIAALCKVSTLPTLHLERKRSDI